MRWLLLSSLIWTSVDANRHPHSCLSIASHRVVSGHRNGRPIMAMATPLSLLKPAAKLYCKSLSSAPILTNCLTASVLSVASDSIAQSVERSRRSSIAPQKHDISRSFWMFAWGFTISGLLIHYWFVFLNSLFPVSGLTLNGAMKKVAVNQLVMSPLLNSLFFTFTTYTRKDVGATRRSTYLRQKFAQDLLPTIRRSCAYWGTIQFVNFLFVPPQFTILYTNIGFLMWTIYISLIGFSQVKE
jgi:hypothetical protein